jgi:hypothetical protein
VVTPSGGLVKKNGHKKKGEEGEWYNIIMVKHNNGQNNIDNGQNNSGEKKQW